MDFTFTAAQLEWQAKAKNFAQEKIAPHVLQLETDAALWQQLFQQLANADFLTFVVPPDEESGIMAYLLAIKEIAKVDAGIAVGMGLTTLVAEAIWRHGSVEQQARYLSRIASGECVPATLALTEKEAGSDFLHILTSAAIDPSDGNFYVLNGEKSYVTNGASAGVFLVVARTAPYSGDGEKGVSVFLIDRGTPGLTITKNLPKLGLLTTNLAVLKFDQCRLSKEQLLGKEGEGLKIVLNLFDNGRLGVAAQSLGIAEGAYESALGFAKQRKQFGRPICEHQAIAFKLSDMHVKLAAAELLLMKAAWLRSRGVPFTVAAATAKLYCSEAANWIANEALQIHGGYGYTKDCLAEKFFRDARVTTLYEGTSEIQRALIAHHLCL